MAGVAPDKAAVGLDTNITTDHFFIDGPDFLATDVGAAIRAGRDYVGMVKARKNRLRVVGGKGSLLHIVLRSYRAIKSIEFGLL